MNPHAYTVTMPASGKWFRKMAEIMLFAFAGLLLCGLLMTHMSLLAAISLVVLILLLGKLVSMIAADFARHNISQVENGDILSRLSNLAIDLYWETGTDGKISAAGGRMLSLFSAQQSDMIGRNYTDIIDIDEDEAFKMRTALQGLQPYSDILATCTGLSGRRYTISLSATPRFNSQNEIIGYLGIGSNVTDRIRNQDKLKRLAERDMLTGLANRYAFNQRIVRELKECSPINQLALMMIDLDAFKLVNDKYGHQAGDALLRMVAKRIGAMTRKSDWVARLGGDEFVMVSTQLANPADACQIADRVTKALAKPYKIGGLVLNVEASVGIACAPGDAEDLQALMKHSDIALYRAKSEGKGCYRLYHEAALLPFKKDLKA
ncbi:MAG: hypothetical protein Hens3KO_00370 [Henriciella sp.]